MGESSLHMRLVQSLVKYISSSLVNGDQAYIFIDAPDSGQNRKPPRISNFVPDVCVPKSPDGWYIIGEAKVAEDFNSRHTEEQILAFLQSCAHASKSMFILAVPWDIVRLARATLKALQVKVAANNVKIVVLEKLPVYQCNA